MDKFQGQQNDYILLSLVRTRNIGHLRDVRRLVVAMSRARLGTIHISRNHNLAIFDQFDKFFTVKLTLKPLKKSKIFTFLIYVMSPFGLLKHEEL